MVYSKDVSKIFKIKGTKGKIWRILIEKSWRLVKQPFLNVRCEYRLGISGCFPCFNSLGFLVKQEKITEKECTFSFLSSYLFVLVFNSNNPPLIYISLTLSLSFLSLCLFSFPSLTSHPTTASVLWLAEFQEGVEPCDMLWYFPACLEQISQLQQEAKTDTVSVCPQC